MKKTNYILKNQSTINVSFWASNYIQNQAHTEKLKNIADTLDGIIDDLSKYGWYINANFSINFILELANYVKQKNAKELENEIIKYYKHNIDGIRKNLLIKYNDRQILLEEAFNAHKREMYFSSTILFLSQADGLCDGNFFLLAKNKKKLKTFLNQKQSPDVVNIVLGKESAIDSWTGHKQKYFSDLNRHDIMHGYCFDFGNEVNSFKALSLLCFMSDFIDSYNKFEKYK